MKYFLFLMLLWSATFSKAQSFLKNVYFFVGTDEMHYYRQSQDTLYEGVTQAVNPKYIDNYERHYKILELIKRKPNFYILKLERLDTIPLTIHPYPADRFEMLIFKKTDNTLELLQQISSLTRTVLQRYLVDTIPYTNNFSFTYYSLPYMKKLMKLKRVKTMNDANKITEQLKNFANHSNMIKAYKAHNKMPDYYATGLTATIINTICIQSGYCPIGASVTINILKSNATNEQKDKRIEAYYMRIFRD